MSAIVGGLCTDVSKIDMKNVKFVHKSTKIDNPNGGPQLTRHNWNIVITEGGETEESEKPFPVEFCLQDALMVRTGLSFKGVSDADKAKLEANTKLVDFIAANRDVTSELPGFKSDKLSVSVAVFLDPTKKSHADFIEFSNKFTKHLQKHINDHPSEMGIKKSKDPTPPYDVKDIVKVSSSGRSYFALKVSSSHDVKGKRYNEMRFYDTQLKVVPWSRLFNSQFQGKFFFKITSFGAMAGLAAYPSLFGGSCRQVCDIQDVESAEDKREKKRMMAIGETPPPRAPRMRLAVDDAQDPDADPDPENASDHPPSEDIHDLGNGGHE